jgi:RNA polymerase-binding transcription factor DksA
VLHVPPSVYAPHPVDSAAKSIHPKWNWHYKTLLQLRDRLLKTRSDHIEAATEPIKPDSMDFSDSAIAESERDMRLSELRAEQDTLYEVDQAIHRILDGTYGRCEETGTHIPAVRLRAVPWTRYSKAVEEKLEHQRAGRAHALGAGHSRRVSPQFAGSP